MVWRTVAEFLANKSRHRSLVEKKHITEQLGYSCSMDPSLHHVSGVAHLIHPWGIKVMPPVAMVQDS